MTDLGQFEPPWAEVPLGDDQPFGEEQSEEAPDGRQWWVDEEDVEG